MQVAFNFAANSHAQSFWKMLEKTGYRGWDDQELDPTTLSFRVDIDNKMWLGWMSTNTYYSTDPNSEFPVDRLIDFIKIKKEVSYYECGFKPGMNLFRSWIEELGFKWANYDRDWASIISLYPSNYGQSEYNVLPSNRVSEYVSLTDISFLFSGLVENSKEQVMSNATSNTTSNVMSNIMSNIMEKNEIAVRVDYPELSEALQKVAFSKGFSWGNGNNVKYTRYNVLFFNKEDSDMCYSCNEERHCDFDAATQFSEIVEWMNSKEEELEIDGYNVKFTSEGIDVGCQRLSKKQVEEIYLEFKRRQEPLMVNDLEVRFFDDSINYDGTEISEEMIEKIWKRMNR